MSYGNWASGVRDRKSVAGWKKEAAGLGLEGAFKLPARCLSRLHSVEPKTQNRIRLRSVGCRKHRKRKHFRQGVRPTVHCKTRRLQNGFRTTSSTIRISNTV